MAVGYYLGDVPSDYGLKDWYHDKNGKIDYSWCRDISKNFYNPDNPTDFKKLAEKQDNSYKESCTDEALDNLFFERMKQEARKEFFEEWERNEVLYN